MKQFATAVLVLLLTVSANAQTNPPPTTLKLARVFASNVVFQHGQSCPVFGVDVPGTAITVTFAGQTLNTTADTTGNWRVNIAPLAVNTSPQTLTVTGNTNIIRTAADQSGADAVDMMPPLADHPEWFPDHIHPNAAGAQRIAEVIYGWLLQHFEVPAGKKLSQLDAMKNGAGEFVVSFPAYANFSYVVQTQANTYPMTEATRYFRLRLNSN